MNANELDAASRAAWMRKHSIQLFYNCGAEEYCAQVVHPDGSCGAYAHHITDDGALHNLAVKLGIEEWKRAPRRVQLSRRKGWRKPENCVIVSRPSRWGNPFVVGETQINADPGPYLVTPESAQECVDLFRTLVTSNTPCYRDYRNEARRVLGGHDLACWCALDAPCHADVLLEIANSPMEE